MNENYQNPIPQQTPEEESEIDWVGYLTTLWSHRKRIIMITGICAVLSVVIALCQKRTYSVGITLAPEIQGSSRSSSLSGLASMLGMGGMTMGNSTDALNITVFPEVVSSTPFLTGLFDVPVTPYVSPKKIREGAEPGQPVLLYDHLTGKDREPGALKQWWRELIGAEEEEESEVNVSLLTFKQSLVVESMRRLITADVDKKTGVTQLRVTLDDPLMATQLADTVCNRLQQYVFEYRTRKERENLAYYCALTDSAYKELVAAQAAYAQSMDNDHSVILQSVSVRKQRLQNEMNLREQVYSQMVQQREVARARVQEMKPVFAVVEPATFPQRPNQSRAKTCIVITFLGFVASCAWYLFGAPFLAKMKDMFARKPEDEVVGKSEDETVIG